MRLLLTAALTALATAALAQAPDDFTAAAFRAHVAFLADDALEGREAGTRGHEVAAAYVAQRFAALGLQPAGDQGSWYQAVRLHERALGPGGATLTIASPGGTKAFANATAAIISPSFTEAQERIEAPAVFVGFGLDAPAQGFDDYRGLDVKGKVVVAFSGTPKGTPSELGAHLNNEKAAMASRRGAVGFVTINTPTSEKVFPWAKRLPYAPLSRLTWVEPTGKPFVEAPGIRLGATLDTPAAELLFAGGAKSLAALRAEADRQGGRPKGFPLKAKLTLDRASTQRVITSPNVAAMIPGSDPALKDEIVLVMGHLDHLGLRPTNEGDKIYNGAMDNATGIAAMIETARALVESGKPPKRSVLFLAVTAEEKGLLGADYFAHHPTLPLERVVGVVNIDMPILTYDFGEIVAFGADSSTLGETARRAAAQIGVKLAPDPAPEQNTFVRSDHYMLVKKGVPSIYLDTGLGDAKGGKSGEAAIDEFVAKHYHEPSDDLSQPIDWNAAAKFARVNYLITREIADAPTRPRWYKGDFFGDTFAGGMEKASRR